MKALISGLLPFAGIVYKILTAYWLNNNKFVHYYIYMRKNFKQKVFNLIILLFVVFMVAFYLAIYQRTLADERDAIKPRISLSQQSVIVYSYNNINKLFF